MLEDPSPKQWKSHSLVITTKAAVYGIVVALILATIINLSTLPIITFLNPSPPELPPCEYLPEGETSSESCNASGGIWPASVGASLSNAVNALIHSFLLSILSIWIGGFVSGLYLNSRRIRSYSRVWNSLASGFILGSIGAIGLFIYFPGPMRPGYTDDIIGGIIFGGTTALFGLAGYYVARLYARWRKVIA